MKFFLPGKKGFTLIEVLLATTLVILGVLAVVNAMAAGLYTDSSVEGQVVALNLAQEEMETLKNTPYVNLSASPMTALTGNFANYSRQVVLTTISTNLTEVTVNVSWNLGLMNSSVSLTTLLVAPS